MPAPAWGRLCFLSGGDRVTHSASGGTTLDENTLTEHMLSGAPYGYRYTLKGEGGGQARYEIVLEEAHVVRQIFDWVGKDRLTLRCTLLQLLRNPAYIGRGAYGKTPVAFLASRSWPLRPPAAALRAGECPHG